jgi:chromate transporter
MHINSEKQEERHQGSALEVLRVFIKLGLTSFGGPIAHIGYFHKTFIEQKKWISEAQFAQLLAVSQFLPGPASSQLGFAIGLHRAGWLGAFSAFIGFTLPSAIVLVFFLPCM